jgi:GNAT superfamily N-acetyltransferase
VLEGAARGRYPKGDGRVDVLPPLPGAADAMIGFTGHFVLAADIAAADVAARTADGDLSVPMSSTFLTWVGDRIGSRPGTFDALLCAFGRGDGAPEWLCPDTDATHGRVERARRYRTDVDVWRTHDGAGVVVVGRGVCERWEIAFEVASEARGRGLGRRLVEASMSLVPRESTVWAQVAPGNAASLRAVIAGGFRPVGAEVLFPRAG